MSGPLLDDPLLELLAMPDELVFYTNPRSRGCIARWMLEETGADYRTESLAYGPAMKTAEFLAINSMGKVPVIVHGGQVISECAAICAYLADAFPDRQLAPEPTDRAAYYRWLFFASGPLEAAVTNASLGLEVPDDQQGMVGYGSLVRVLDTLEKAVDTSGFLAGERFSAADVYVGSQIGFGLQFGSIPQRPAFEAYWQRVCDREAWRRAQRLDDVFIPG